MSQKNTLELSIGIRAGAALRRAREHLTDPGHWVKGQWRQVKYSWRAIHDDEAFIQYDPMEHGTTPPPIPQMEVESCPITQTCVLGALGFEAMGRVAEGFDAEGAIAAEELLNKTLEAQGSPPDVAHYNDRPARTHGEILELLDETIDNYAPGVEDPGVG